MPNELAKPRNKGQFVEGHKGKGGRPKGSKNKATIRKELATAKADKIMFKALPAAARILVEKALEGDPQFMKMYLDRTVATHKATEGETGTTNNAVTIRIENLTSPHKEDKPGVTINGENYDG